MDNNVFVEEGVLFTVEQEADGKYVVDIAIGDTRGRTVSDIEDWARVVGRFNSIGEAITAAKYEIDKMS